jgi:hypothetical protein
VDSIRLYDNQDCPVAVTWEKPDGTPAKVDGATTWRTTDAAICSVTVDPTDSTKATLSAWPDPNGAVTNRECDVACSADADLGSGVTTIVSLIHVVVQPAMADHGDIEAGAPVTRPPAGSPQPASVSAPVAGAAPMVGAAGVAPTS